MTAKEKIIGILEQMGMSKDQAEQVIEAFIKSNMNTDGYWTQQKLQSPETDYPAILYTALLKPLKRVGLRWIEENCPNAWFKPMFF